MPRVFLSMFWYQQPCGIQGLSGEPDITISERRAECERNAALRSRRQGLRGGAPKPANKPTSKPANQPANQPTNQPTSQPTSQQSSQPPLRATGSARQTQRFARGGKAFEEAPPPPPGAAQDDTARRAPAARRPPAIAKHGDEHGRPWCGVDAFASGHIHRQSRVQALHPLAPAFQVVRP